MKISYKEIRRVTPARVDPYGILSIEDLYDEDQCREMELSWILAVLRRGKDKPLVTEWDTTWNCQSGRLSDLDADVAYDPWDDPDDHCIRDNGLELIRFEPYRSDYEIPF